MADKLVEIVEQALCVGMTDINTDDGYYFLTPEARHIFAVSVVQAVEEERLRSIEPREIIGIFTRNVIYTERQRKDGLLTSIEWISQIFEHKAWLEAQILAIKPTEEEIRKAVAGEIKRELGMKWNTRRNSIKITPSDWLTFWERY